jgi:hypothetical protein
MFSTFSPRSWHRQMFGGTGATKRGPTRRAPTVKLGVEVLEERQLLALVINPTFASTITSDPSAATIESTINRAIQNIENAFSDSVNVAITFQEMTSGLGQSNWSYIPVSYSSYRSALVSHATTAADSTALASLPGGSNNPVNGNGSINLQVANAVALGLYSGTATGTISLNTSICNLDRSSVNPNKYDLLGVAMHEIDEVLGFGSALNGLHNGDAAPTGAVWGDDLYRYDQNGARSFNTTRTTQAYFSIDGSTTDLARFNQTAGGDFSDWYAPGGQTPHVQDAFATPGATPNLGFELTRLDVLGYTPKPDAFRVNLPDGSVVYLTGYHFNRSTDGTLSVSNVFGSYIVDTGVQSFAVDGAGTLYILHTDGSLYRDQAGSTSYQEYFDWNVQTIAVDGAGSLFALHTDHALYRTPAGTNDQEYFDWNVQTIAVDGAGSLFASHTDHTLYRTRAGTNNQEYFDWNVQTIAVDDVGALLALHDNGDVYRTLAGSSTTTMLDWNVRSIAVRSDGAVFALRSDNMLLVNGQPSWAGIRDFALDGQGRLITLDTLARLDRLTFGTWTWEPMGRDVTKFAVRSDGAIFALRSDNMLLVNGQPSWAGIRDFAMDGQGRLITLDTLARLDRLTFGTWTWEPMGRDVTKFAVRNDGAVFALRSDNMLLVNNQPSWAGIRDFALDGQGRLITLDTLARLDRLTFGTWTWEPMGTDVTKFAVGNDGAVFGLRSDNMLLVNGQPSWAGIRDFALTRGSRLYVLSTGGLLQRLTGSVWEDLAIGVTQFSLDGDELVHIQHV